MIQLHSYACRHKPHTYSTYSYNCNDTISADAWGFCRRATESNPVSTGIAHAIANSQLLIPIWANVTYQYYVQCFCKYIPSLYRLLSFQPLPRSMYETQMYYKIFCPCLHSVTFQLQNCPRFVFQGISTSKCNKLHLLNQIVFANVSAKTVGLGSMTHVKGLSNSRSQVIVGKISFVL